MSKKIHAPILIQVIQDEFGLEAVAEHHFHDSRKWRFDVAIPEMMVAIELEGGVYTKGRHTRGAGFVKDIEKYNKATVMGWNVLRYTHTNHIYADIIGDLANLFKTRQSG